MVLYIVQFMIMHPTHFFFPKVGDINSSKLLVFSHFYEKKTIFVTLFASVGKHAFSKWGLL